MSSFPSGTVTFLFTDIEGSTRLWQEQPEAMSSAHTQHNAILREAIETNNGFIFQIVGDSFSAAFHNAADALYAAVAAQHRLQTKSWDEGSVINVRMGLHTGAAELITDGSNQSYDGYVTLASAQRVMSVAHGGQILLSQTTHHLLQNDLPEYVSLRDMGEHRLKGLHSPLHLFQIVAPDLQQDFPAIQSPDTFPNNLPVQLTSFIGRERELAEIRAKLRSARLVTLTGSGGTGKTRLSLEVGAQELTSFANGVWLIELAPLTNASQIMSAIAQVFGLQEHPFGSLPTVVVDYLRDKKILLIIDNCEHLIEACARLADDLLHQCSGLKILASSREALGIAGEQVYHTPSLAESESTRLFFDRALAVHSSFHLTESNASFIAQICSRLDGIPLAIELAAARTRLLSPEQIAARLDDRFRLLVGGSRTALPRQQTLRALIDWSYDLLSEEEKKVLRTAAVFVGGWTLDALEAVTENPDVLEHLEGLVNKSLVVTEQRETEMRYFMLETIRQYAREKLFDAKETSAVRDRHFAYFDDLSEKLWNVFRSFDTFDWREKAEAEDDNFRAALEWGLQNHIEDAVHLAGHYCTFSSWLSKQSDGLALVKTALERLNVLPPVDGEAFIHRQKIVAKALLEQGTIAFGAGDMSLVIKSLKDAIAISRMTGDKLILGYSLEILSSVSTFMEIEGIEQAAQEGFKIFTEEVDDPWGLSLAYQSQAWLANRRGEVSEKEKYFEKIRELLRDVPFSFQAGLFYLGMGLIESVQQNYDTARQLFEDGLRIFTGLKNRYFQTALKSELGHVARRSGDTSQAKKVYDETLREWRDLGNRAAIAHQLECFAFLAIADEEPQRAIRLFGAAEALRERSQATMTEPERVEYSQAIPGLRSMLPEKEFTSLWTEGRTMTLEQAIQMALDSESAIRG